jgi:hypothetical protein
MDWKDLFPYLLFLHVLGAIVAFGPTFSFRFIGAMGGAEPQHVNFATRVTHTLTSRLVLPIGITLPITGLAMILVLGLDLTSRSFWWAGPRDRAVRVDLRLRVLRAGQGGPGSHRKDVDAPTAGRIGAAARHARPRQACPARRHGNGHQPSRDHLPHGRQTNRLSRPVAPARSTRAAATMIAPILPEETLNRCPMSRHPRPIC